MAINIITKATNIEITPAIEEYLFKKMAVLERYVDEEDSGLQAAVELEKTTDHHLSGKIFRAEISLQSARGTFRAEETAEDLYAAIDATKDEMVRVLSEGKGKRIERVRSGNRRAKEILREVE